MKIFLAALSGGLLVLCFPRAGLFWLAPPILVLILVICYSSKPRDAFFYGWAAGAVFFAGLCSWVGIYGIAPLLIMAAILGLCFAAAFSGISICVRGMPWWVRLWAAPALWTLIEILRSETGAYSFPYGVIGYAFHSFGPALGLASVVGVYGVSFLVVMASAGALEAGIAIRAKQRQQAATRGVFTVVIIATAIVSGQLLFQGLASDSGPSMKVALVQASIPQDQKWLASKRGEIMDKYESLVLKAGRAKPDLIILPEAALPAYVRQDDALAVRLRSWSAKTKTPLLAGVPLLKGSGAYNTAVLFDKYGRQSAIYAKNTPVPFGEMIPFRSLSETIYPDFKQMGDISTGTEPTIFRVPGTGMSFSTLICSESMYSRLAIGMAALEPDYVIVITNDGWFYSSNEAELHFAMTKFRASETGKYIAQAANTGISAVISPSGGVEGDLELNKTGVSIAVVHARPGRTVFTLWGWLFTYSLIIISAVAALTLGLVKVCTKPQNASII